MDLKSGCMDEISPGFCEQVPEKHRKDKVA